MGYIKTNIDNYELLKQLLLNTVGAQLKVSEAPDSEGNYTLYLIAKDGHIISQEKFNANSAGILVSAELDLENKRIIFHRSGGAEDIYCDLEVLIDRIDDEKITIIIDEFPYIANDNQSIKRALKK